VRERIGTYHGQASFHDRTPGLPCSFARAAENFLAIRGDELEHKRWASLKAEAARSLPDGRRARLEILPDPPLPSVLTQAVSHKCRPAVALGFAMGCPTLIDDIMTIRRLRYHPSPRLKLLLTPEGKLRASYLGPI
jgi:hypothetical protein